MSNSIQQAFQQALPPKQRAALYHAAEKEKARQRKRLNNIIARAKNVRMRVGPEVTVEAPQTVNAINRQLRMRPRPMPGFEQVHDHIMDEWRQVMKAYRKARRQMQMYKGEK